MRGVSFDTPDEYEDPDEDGEGKTVYLECPEDYDKVRYPSLQHCLMAFSLFKFTLDHQLDPPEMIL